MRILHYAQFLAGFTYNVVHRKSELHASVDYFSRFPLSSSNTITNDSPHGISTFQIAQIETLCTPTLTHATVATETRKDETLQQILNGLEDGTLTSPEYTLEKGVLLRGHRVVVPKLLQKAVLQELQATHTGIVKIKSLARNYVWWKNIDHDIEHLVRSC